MNPNAQAFKNRFKRFSPEVGDVLSAPKTDTNVLGPSTSQQTQKTKPTNWDAIKTAIVKKYPNLSKTQMSQLEEKINRRKMIEGVKLGTLTLEDVAGVDKQLALDLKAQGIKDQPAQSPEVQTIEDVFASARSLNTGGERTKALDATTFALQIQDVLSALNESEKEGIVGLKGSGPIVNAVSGAAEAVGIDSKQAALRDKLDNLRQLIRKERTGVQFSEKELEELNRIFGNISTQEAPLRRKLEDLLSQSTNEIAASTGVSREGLDTLFGVKSPSQEKDPNLTRPLDNPLVDFFLGGTRNVIQDVIATPGAKGQTEASQNELDQLQIRMEQAIESGDMESLKQVQQELANVSQTLKQTAGKFSEGVEVPDITGNRTVDTVLNAGARGLGVGIEIGTLLEAPGTIKSVFSFTDDMFKNALKKGSKIAPKGVEKAVAERTQAALKSNAVFDGDELVKAGDDLAKNNPRVRKIWETLKPELDGKAMNTEELLKKIKDWNADTYTTGGDVASRSTAKLFETLANTSRRMLEKQAPEVFAKQADVARAMSMKNIVKELTNARKIASSVRGAAAAGATFYFLSRFLGMGGGGYSN